MQELQTTFAKYDKKKKNAGYECTEKLIDDGQGDLWSMRCCI